MERLTEKHYLAEDHYMKCSGTCHVDMDCIDCPAFDQFVERLAAYEDTGLTPEEVAAAKMALMGKTLAEITEFEGVPIARLRALAEADKDGRCVVLPCKVGDTVYQLRRKTHARVVDISPRIVSSACVWKDGSYALTHQGMLYCQSGDLGKTWFLTREEAERALQEMEGKKDGDETSL